MLKGKQTVHKCHDTLCDVNGNGTSPNSVFFMIKMTTDSVSDHLKVLL